MDKIEELVEWARLTEDEIIEAHNRWCRRGQSQLKISWRQWQNQAQVYKAYSHPDLALMVLRDEVSTTINCGIIPLADALKEATNE